MSNAGPGKSNDGWVQGLWLYREQVCGRPVIAVSRLRGVVVLLVPMLAGKHWKRERSMYVTELIVCTQIRRGEVNGKQV